MTRLLVCALMVPALLLLGPAAPGQDKNPFAPPGKEHQGLAELAGTFKATVKVFPGPGMDPIASTGTLTRKMIMNGRYLQESYSGKFGDEPFKGMGLVGYDDHKKKYTSVWIDSMSNAMMVSEGEYDPETKKVVSWSKGFDPFLGKEVYTRDVLTILSPTRQKMEMYKHLTKDDKGFRSMEIVYEKVEGKKGKKK